MYRELLELINVLFFFLVFLFPSFFEFCLSAQNELLQQQLDNLRRKVHSLCKTNKHTHRHTPIS